MTSILKPQVGETYKMLLVEFETGKQVTLKARCVIAQLIGNNEYKYAFDKYNSKKVPKWLRDYAEEPIGGNTKVLAFSQNTKAFDKRLYAGDADIYATLSAF
jgi:hypothetical protein